MDALCDVGASRVVRRVAGSEDAPTNHGGQYFSCASQSFPPRVLGRTALPDQTSTLFLGGAPCTTHPPLVGCVDRPVGRGLGFAARRDTEDCVSLPRGAGGDMHDPVCCWHRHSHRQGHPDTACRFPWRAGGAHGPAASASSRPGLPNEVMPHPIREDRWGIGVFGGRTIRCGAVAWMLASVR